MKKIISLLTIFNLVLLAACVSKEPMQQYQVNICDELANKLDSVIEDTNNPLGNFRITGWEGIVGGTLTNIENKGFSDYSGYYEYDLTFKGKGKKGKLYLITKTYQELPYQIGQFYKFDLANRNKYSAALSGSFIDNNADKLTSVSCE